MTGFLDWLTAWWVRLRFGPQFCPHGHDITDHERLGRCTGEG